MENARAQYELGMQCLAKNEYSRARKHLRKAIEMSPNAAAFHWGMGSVYCHQPEPDYEAAIAEFQKVIALKPEWIEGHYCLASSLEASGALEQSIQHYEKAIDLAPNDSRPVIAYGVCLTKLKRHKSAIRLLRHGVKLKPHYGEASAHLFLADALLGHGDTKAACKNGTLF